jgi:hypothetical protein
MASDYRIVNSEYPLQTAASYGSNRWLKSLLQADEELPRFAVQEALAEAVYEDHPDSVQLLLAAGADAADYLWEEGSEENVPLVQAFAHCNPEVVKQLIAAGAVSRSDSHWVDDAIDMGLRCRRKSKNECLILLADQIVRRLDEESAPTFNPRLMKKLATKLRKMKAQGPPDPRELADSLKRFVDEGEALREELLTEITEGEDRSLDLVWKLLAAQPAKERQRLASDAFPYLVRCIRRGSSAWPLFDAFLDWGADVNRRDTFEATGLIWLGIHEDIPIDAIEKLLDLGADVNAADYEGRTILDWMRDYGKEDSEAWKFLRERGAKTGEELRSESSR